MHMLKAIKLAALLFVFASLCFGQHSSGYVFAGPASFANSVFTYWQGTRVHAGGGGEVGIGQYFSVGGEAGALLGNGDSSRNALLLSANPTFHFVRHSEEMRVDPFLTTGPTLLASNGAAFLWNFGGGMNYWFSRRIGARIEFRDHVWPTEGIMVHIASLRLGLSFR